MLCKILLLQTKQKNKNVFKKDCYIKILLLLGNFTIFINHKRLLLCNLKNHWKLNPLVDA